MNFILILLIAPRVYYDSKQHKVRYIVLWIADWCCTPILDQDASANA